MDTSDKALVRLALKGNKNAFSILVARYQKSLKIFLANYCPVPEDIDDICQESLRKAYQSLPSYDPKYSFNTWLFSIARNTAIDMCRRENACQKIMAGEGGGSLADTGATVSSPEDNMIGVQTYESLIRAIDGLPELYREAARLRFIHEYAYEEIASQLSLPLNTVRTRLRRAKGIILQQLKCL